MIIKELRYTDNVLKYISYHLKTYKKQFIILNDMPSVKFNQIKSLYILIKKYNYNLQVISLQKISQKIIKLIKKANIDFDTVVLVGTGGKVVFENIKNNSAFKNKNVFYVKWNRVWEGTQSLGFSTDINKFDLRNKKVILIEDVIASGNTLWTLKKCISNRKGAVQAIFSVLIQEGSLISQKSFAPTYSICMIRKTGVKDLNPFWYPPIYSLRHLLYGDLESSLFYEELNKRYFNNEKIVETRIKKIREEI